VVEVVDRLPVEVDGADEVVLGVLVVEVEDVDVVDGAVVDDEVEVVVTDSCIKADTQHND